MGIVCAKFSYSLPTFMTVQSLNSLNQIDREKVRIFLSKSGRPNRKKKLTLVHVNIRNITAIK